MTSQDGSAVSQLPVALIIEDDPHFSGLLAFHLRAQGYQPVQVYRGLEAEAAARAVQPALITLDILLPDRDGWSVLSDLQRDPHSQRVPVLIISVVEEAIQRQVGPTLWLQKPFKRGQLVETVMRLVPTLQRPARVLVVDDDPMMSDMVRAILPPDFTVHAALNSDQALSRIRAEVPDILLLDLVLPNVDGWGLLADVRADPRACHVPVLVLTAKHLTPHEQEQLCRAARLTLLKQAFTPEALIEKVRYLAGVAEVMPLTAPERPALAGADEDVDLSLFEADFVAEARRHLLRIRAVLDDRTYEVVEGAARAAHTLKGSAAIMRRPELSQAAAEAERLLLSNLTGAGPFDRDRLARLREVTQRIDALIGPAPTLTSV